MSTNTTASFKGPAGWMLANPVAANLLMLFFLVGGLITLPAMQRELFPDAQLDVVNVVLPYPGATPEDVEEGVILPVESAIRGLDGIDTIRSVAGTGNGTVIAELVEGADANVVLNDIESEVNRITSFPPRAEEPVISIPSNQVQVLTLILYGDLDRIVLDRLARSIRGDLLRMPAVAKVEVQGVPPPEISIEVSQENLRRYGLTRRQIGELVAASTVEMGGGRVRSDAGFVALRTTEEREWAEAFEDLTVISDPSGVNVTLGDIATIKETFQDKDIEASMNGKPAIGLNVYRGVDSSPTEVAAVVRNYIENNTERWGSAVNHLVWNNRSLIYKDRVGLLVRNGFQGLLLVLVILGIFLRPQLAFWVTLGIPISFLGAFIALPALGVSINMLSLFAFILVLGIVVDDAIVVGEAAYGQSSAGLEQEEAAYRGVSEVRIPVIFAVTTTLMVFIPMLFIPGVTGEFFSVIPKVVIPILALSLIESMLILPVHIAHLKKTDQTAGWLRWVTEKQQKFSDGFEKHAERMYRPLIRFVIGWRYPLIGFSLIMLAVGAGLVQGNHIGFFFMPKIEGKNVRAKIELPPGSSLAATREKVQSIEAAARQIIGDNTDVLRGIFAMTGSQGNQQLNLMSASSSREGVNLALIEVGFIAPDKRAMSAKTFAREWREMIRKMPGIDQLEVSYSIGPSSGKTLSFELSYPRYEILKEIASKLAERLDNTAGVFEVDRGYDLGAPEITIQLKPAGRALGVSSSELGSQVRSMYFGRESFRQPRGRDELRIYIRATDAERTSLAGLEQMLVLTPNGEIPLAQAAELTWSRSPTAITRKDGRRIITVTGDVDPRITTANEISSYTQEKLIPELQKNYGDLRYSIGGEQQSQRESMQKIFKGLLLAFLAMYALIATVFKSYTQPLLIFVAIPYGWAAAILGHLVFGYDLTIVSILGMLALSGVVINDSLVLIYAVNDRRSQGMELDEAIENGGLRRLRPVMLTSLTTFFGLSPMITETSVQARFLIPMAISLGIGVLFVTIITLMIVPAAYRILHDLLPDTEK